MTITENKILLEKALEIIQNKSIDAEFTADSLSKEVGVSRSQILSAFKTFVGMEPRVYIRNFRMDQSINLLKKTNYSVSDIASQSGFKSASYFSYCFKLIFNCTPSEKRSGENIMQTGNGNSKKKNKSSG